MNAASECPRDRSELVSVIEERAGEELRAHVDECDRCRVELRELRSGLELLAPLPHEPPSRRVREAAVAYAQAQVAGIHEGGFNWKAAAAVVLGGGLALVSGELAQARMASAPPTIETPGLWTCIMAVLWSLAAFAYSHAGSSAKSRALVGRALAGAAVFTSLSLAYPAPLAVDLVAELAPGTRQLALGQVWWIHPGLVALYAGVSSALAGHLMNDDLSTYGECWAACLFMTGVGPLLIIQAAHTPIAVSAAGVGSVWCGALIGGLLLRRARRWVRR